VLNNGKPRGLLRLEMGGTGSVATCKGAREESLVQSLWRKVGRGLVLWAWGQQRERKGVKRSSEMNWVHSEMKDLAITNRRRGGLHPKWTKIRKDGSEEGGDCGEPGTEKSLPGVRPKRDSGVGERKRKSLARRRKGPWYSLNKKEVKD